MAIAFSIKAGPGRAYANAQIRLSFCCCVKREKEFGKFGICRILKPILPMRRLACTFTAGINEKK